MNQPPPQQSSSQQSQTQQPQTQQPVLYDNNDHQQLLIRCLHQIDPILQFLTRATGHDRIPLSMIYKAMPNAIFSPTTTTTTTTTTSTTNVNPNLRSINISNDTTTGSENHDQRKTSTCQYTKDEMIFLQNIHILCSYGILAWHQQPRNHHQSYCSNDDDDDDDDNHDCDTTTTCTNTTTVIPIIHNNNNNNNNNNCHHICSWDDDPTISLGFPLPSTTPKLHGSTKTAAKRRTTALKKILKQESKQPGRGRVHVASDCSTNIDHNNKSSTSSSTDHNTDPPTNTEVIVEEKLNHTNGGTTDSRQSMEQTEITTNASISHVIGPTTNNYDDEDSSDIQQTNNLRKFKSNDDQDSNDENNHTENFPIEHEIPDDALDTLHRYLGFSNDCDTTLYDPSLNSNSRKDTKFVTSAIDTVTMSHMIPRQASYAGSIAAQESICTTLSDRTIARLPTLLLRALHIDVGQNPNVSSPLVVDGRRLYSHQATAIEAVMDDIHCSVCTGTGSGKSLCYLLPALTAAYNDNHTSLLLFPTKALAQDQLSKILSIVASDPELQQRIRPATLDGDTSHSARSRINDCNIILTNPDILHTSILPSWRTKTYRQMLSSLRYVAVDEAHVYNGVFGAHVAMILRRLVRIACIASVDAVTTNVRKLPTFIATSATLHNPMEHFRLLCPIGMNVPLKVISSQDDGSPRSAKHFFVWNPPVLTLDGTSTNRMYFPKPKPSIPGQGPTVTPDVVTHDAGKKSGQRKGRKRHRGNDPRDTDHTVDEASTEVQTWTIASRTGGISYMNEYRRRHAAEETARLLARSVANGIRCIAFCKTRNLVEWVYTRTIDALKHDPSTKSLVSKVESYRGGYTVTERRKIEEKLFRNNILGVVGTNALELGVDIGGIDLTLHCGYPSSYTSLLQQAGRSGRGKDRLGTPSVAIVVCFASPLEQQLWRRPASLLSKGPSSATSIPFQEDLVQGHLLCASEEFPLSGSHSLASIAGTSVNLKNISDRNLFGDVYDNALDFLRLSGAITEEQIPCLHNPKQVQILWKARPSLCKPSSRLSIRSIEPIQYSIVDLSHSSQRGRSDGIHDTAAVLDTIPYSRVFYHAHPGAIITHRGKKYEIIAMTQPPEFTKENYGYMRSQQLAAYVRPTTATYLTRPLADTLVTIVKQFENVEINESSKSGVLKSPHSQPVNFAGCGVVSVKRQVRGYKKLSLVNFSEIARTELTLPPIEFDTFGLYVCSDQHSLSPLLGERYGPGVHALSHALLAVAPLFASGLTRGDIECCHEFYCPSKIILFDERAGGSGCVQRIWRSFFEPNGILESAVDLLNNCSSCKSDPRFDSGCPACLHASQCSKFNTHLSRSAAIVIGERMMDRIKETSMYNSYNNVTAIYENQSGAIIPSNASVDITPRRKARQQAMQKAKEMQSSRDRQFVISRPSWPLDGQNTHLEHG